MKLNRIPLIMVLLCLLLAGSCSKKDELVYTPLISGVNLRTIDATPAGKEGMPDVHTEDPQVSIVCYPNPVINAFNILITNTKPATTVHLRLVNALYEHAPANAVIENRWLVGSVAINESFPLSQTTMGRFSLDVSKLPRGFYKLYIEMDDGGRYWDNIWLMN